MSKVLALLGSLLLSMSAIAASGNLSFSRPVARSDGSPLAASEIASYQIACSFAPVGGSAAACSGLSPSSLAGSSLGGVVSFNASQDGRACFSLSTVDSAGRVSVPSASACKDIAIAPPNPPGNVVVAFNVTINGQSVQVALVPAFGVTAAGGRSSTVYGFVKSGAPCVGNVLFTYRGASYRRVPREHVGWWRTAANDNAAAPCVST